MKILCVLQNAWGYGRLPMVFTPNPANKSAKVIRKMVGANRYYFSNTTAEVTNRARDKAKPDDKHFISLTKKFNDYDLILVCGAQAKKMFEKHIEVINNVKSEIMFVPHPASRMLSNVQINEIREEIAKLKSNA